MTEAMHKSGHLSGAFPVIMAVVSQVAVITALLYYFGWVRTQAAFAYFGVDVGLLGFSTSDYVLRSLNSAIPLLIVAGLIVMGATALHRPFVELASVAAGDRTRRVITISAVVVVAAVLVVILVLGMFPLRIRRVATGYPLPLALIGIVFLAAFGWQVWATDGDNRSHPGARVWAVLLSALALLGMLWLIALYAQDIGERRGAEIAAKLNGGTEVVLYSSERLAIDGPGVIDQPLAQEGSRYRVRYLGLRLLARTPDSYLLVPADWRKGSSSVFVVNTDDSVRLDLISVPDIGPEDQSGR